jgi:hypothetical protein
MSAIGLLLDPHLFSRTAAAPAPDAIELALEYCDYAQTIPTTVPYIYMIYIYIYIYIIYMYV